jgi:hypothetical protein
MGPGGLNGTKVTLLLITCKGNVTLRYLSTLNIRTKPISFGLTSVES